MKDSQFPTVRVYDSGPKTIDRYTAVFLNREDYGHTKEYIQRTGRDFYPCLAMNSAPFHPQGFGQHCECMLGRHLGKRIDSTKLSADCQQFIKQNI